MYINSRLNVNVKMTENQLKRIKSQLNAKFYAMNDSWLRICVEFFVRDKAPNERTDKHVFKFVEAQWQLSDLREISNETGCLPRNITQQMRTVLTGTYILQVNKMYDIAHSKYKQLCEIRKKISDNLEVTEKDKPAEWEPKGRRMMQWCLTDGVQDITAIEYVPFKQLTCDLLPGYKVMIIGPVDCRRGVILLESSKYREIGGEVESLLKPNALENVLARALDEPENPDPYHDNGLVIVQNQNDENVSPSRNGDDSVFDDDFEQAVDLEVLTEIERRSQEVVETVQSCDEGDRRERRQTTQTSEKGSAEVAEEFLEDIDFEPLEEWSDNDAFTRSSRLSLVSRMEIEKLEDSDVMIVEEESSHTRNPQNRSSLSASSSKNITPAAEFPDEDFDFDDFEIVNKTKLDSQRQNERSTNFKNETGTRFSPQMPKLGLTSDVRKEVKKPIPTKLSIVQNERLTASTSRRTTQEAKTKTICSFFLPAIPSSKICEDLRDVLKENITETIHRTVKAHVKTHSALKKQGSCWRLTAEIADHTSSVEVCFDSEVLEKYLGFTVQEFAQKKKLAKSDSQVDKELRESLREAQHQIENLNALLKLELVQDQIPKVVDIMQLTEQQKEELSRRRV